MDYMPDDLEGEAPCEFCNELYPLVLLIEHQSIHLTGEDDFSYLNDMLTHEEIAQNIIAEDLGLSSKPEVIVEKQQQSAVKDKPEVIVEQKQQSPAKIETKTSDGSAKTEQKRSASETKAENITKEQNLFSKALNDIKKFPEQKGKEFITEKGEKLSLYGDEIDPDKELENEKPDYKIPNNPLLSSICKNEDVEDVNNLSDDDCNETLEEFWKRARDFLKRNRVRNETSC